MGLIGGIAKKELGESDLKNSKEIEKSLGEATTNKVTVKRTFKELLVYYTVPIVSIVLFLAIVGFFVVPTISGIYTNLNKVEDLKKKKDADKPTLTSLVKLRDNDQQTQDDLAVVDKIVPSEKTKIVTLQKFIQDTVEKYGLTLKLSSVFLTGFETSVVLPLEGFDPDDVSDPTDIGLNCSPITYSGHSHNHSTYHQQ
jgi:hypothetical protein